MENLCWSPRGELDILRDYEVEKGIPFFVLFRMMGKRDVDLELP
jgi:hypothetical protein